MKNSTIYDVVIIGAGPAGLSAARTSARLGFSTVVLERLNGAGELSHPCGGVVAPIPRLALGGGSGPDAGRPASNLYFRKIDLSIPTVLVKGYPRQQYWMSPGGRAFTAPLAGHKEYRAAVIDKPGLLRLMAGQAWAAGAELRFGTEVTGLAKTDAGITSVRTTSGDVWARMVLSAQGISRRLGEPIEPRTAGKAERYAFVIGQELEAPAVGLTEVGQFVTLGRRYTSARDAVGMLVAPAPGRLSVYFTLFAHRPDVYTERTARFFIEEYMREDPRVAGLCAGARAVRHSSAVMALTNGPTRVVADSFLAIGDAIAPAGYLGILPAISMGRQAALIAADAIEAGDTSARRLAAYEHLIRQRVLPALLTEAQLMVDLARKGDDEIDAFCENAESRRSTLPLSPQARSLQWESSKRQLSAGGAWQLPQAERTAIGAMA